MSPNTLSHWSALLLVTAISCASAPAATVRQDVKPHAGMLRNPGVSAENIVFVYADDLWVVPRAGGVASPLASPAGREGWPRFSADGATVAFVGNYDGGNDLYTLPVEGGVPHRVTHHPANEVLCGWAPDGKLLYFSNGWNGLGRQSKVLKVDPSGGLPEPLPVPYGTWASISADGRWLAYTPHTRDHRTWKRYRGGMATDVWLFDLQNRRSQRVTDWEGTDSQPMWHGGTLYYISDAGPEHRINVWSYERASGQRRQVTTFAEHDVRWPSVGPGASGGGEIVFSLGADLMLLDLATGRSRVVEVRIPGARPEIRDKVVDASDNATGFAVSPTAKRVAAEARGDIWTLPAEKGAPRNLTRTSGAAERSPAWSPDGRWVAYLSDESGEYELYVRQSDGKGDARRLTQDGDQFRMSVGWSPDSKHLTFTDKSGGFWLTELESGATKLIDRDPLANYPNDMDVSWSHDSSWIAYARALDDRFTSAVWLYEVATGEAHRVTSGVFNDGNPTFDREGDYLFYVSSRHFQPTYGDLDTTWIYAGTQVLLVVPLRADVDSPFLAKSDEETWEDADAKDSDDEASDEHEDEDGQTADDDEASEHDESAEGEHGDGDDDDDADDAEEEEDEEPLVIDLDGFEARAVPLPVDPGNFGELAVNDSGKLIYLRRAPRGSDDPSTIKIFDLEDDEREEKDVVSPGGPFGISADGKKLIMASRRGSVSLLDASAGAKPKDVPTDGMDVTVSPRAEWRQVLREAWRIYRDFFYAENMHGVDWERTYDVYAAMLDDCATRRDVSTLIAEMIAELNVGHAYYSGGDVEDAPRVGVGLLGADFALEDGAYRIAHVYEGASWDSDARGPLSQPGVDVNVGDYLLAVNGVPVDTSADPWAAFVGVAGDTVVLTVSSEPTPSDEARDVVVETLRSEGDLRYREWVERNRAYVAERTEGRVGYIYVPNTGVDGQNELVRQFYSQLHCDALIVDDRWNGGGQIPTRFVELLNRPVVNFWARRDGRDWQWPPDANPGPKCMLINGLAGSGGDAFPAYFRQAGLGKLVGMRTWGGLVGLSGNPGLIDGGRPSVPTFGFYELDGTWGIEGHGVDPDIEVVDDPALMVDGGDPQLDAAIDLMLSELGSHPFVRPERPEWPDRSGMGLAPEDH